MLYHASCVSGLKVLEPHISTHKQPYVYAINSKLTALLFGAPKDDFDLLIDFENGRPIVYECYPNALQTVYSQKSCSVYTVEETGFLKGMTGWDQELVCPSPVPVVCEERVNDIYEEILLALHNNQCVIHFFEESDAFLSFLKDELQERVTAFGITPEYRSRDERFTKYHNKLLGL